MQKNSKFFDDIARMASSAGGTFMEMKREIEANLGSQMEKMLKRMDVVTREDYNLVREMAIKARTEQEALAHRVAELEKAVGIKTSTKKQTAQKTPADSPKPASSKAKPKAEEPLKKAGTTAKKPAAKRPAAKKTATKKTTNSGSKTKKTTT